MKKSLTSLFLVSMLALVVQSAMSDTIEEQVANGRVEQEADTQNPYVTVNIGVEIMGLEQAAEQAAEGLNLIGQALHELANDPELSAEHQQKIDRSERASYLTHQAFV